MEGLTSLLWYCAGAGVGLVCGWALWREPRPHRATAAPRLATRAECLTARAGVDQRALEVSISAELIHEWLERQGLIAVPRATEVRTPEGRTR